MRRPVSVLALAIALATLPAVAASPRVMPIGQVQGLGERSPLEGRQVTVEAMLTADLRQGLGGVFVQDAGDGDARTSDALFVQAGGELSLLPGQWWRITGTVVEQPAGKDGQALTSLADARFTAMPARAPVPVQALSDVPESWEALEGMQVRIDAPLTLVGQDQLPRFGELVVAFGGRLWQPSEVAVPGSDEHAAVVADNQRRRLRLDDGSSERDPKQVVYLPAGSELRTGMELRGVQGIVDQRHDGQYRLQLTAPLSVPPVERPAAPQVEGDVRIAAFNLENFFNGNGRGAGFPTARGAKTEEAMRAQLAKLVETIRGLDPDVAALMELENDGYDEHASIAQLVAALNQAERKHGDWRFVDAGKDPGTNPIRVGILYRARRVKPVGTPAGLEREPFGERSRVPLAQAFRAGRGKPFVVVANHFKSKGCSGATGADADQGDGQACWAATRTESARLLHQWLQTDPTGSRSQDMVLLGDFNAYAMESPIRQLHADGWQDAFVVAGIERPYSYVYGGLAGRLDHALLSPGMAARLRGAAEWHINADEADSLGYAEGNVAGPWRSSDHDPLLIGIAR